MTSKRTALRSPSGWSKVYSAPGLPKLGKIRDLVAWHPHGGRAASPYVIAELMQGKRQTQPSSWSRIGCRHIFERHMKLLSSFHEVGGLQSFIITGVSAVAGTPTRLHRHFPEAHSAT